MAIESIQTAQGAPPVKPNKSSEDAKQVQTREGQNIEKHDAARSDKDAIQSNKVETASSKEAARIEKAAEDLQAFVDSIGRELSFEVHDKAGDVVIKVFRKSDGALVREIPPENTVKLAESDTETPGLLLEEHA